MLLMPVCGSSPRDKFANSTERISSRLHAGNAGDAGDAGDALRRSRRRVSVRRIC